MKRLTKKVLITSGMGTAMLLAAGTGVAGAQSSVYSEPLPVVNNGSAGITSSPTPTTDPNLSVSTGTPTTTASTASLAFTGADITAMVAVGLAMAGGGFVLVRLGRRRSIAE